MRDDDGAGLAPVSEVHGSAGSRDGDSLIVPPLSEGLRDGHPVTWSTPEDFRRNMTRQGWCHGDHNPHPECHIHHPANDLPYDLSLRDIEAPASQSPTNKETQL